MKVTAAHKGRQRVDVVPPSESTIFVMFSRELNKEATRGQRETRLQVPRDSIKGVAYIRDRILRKQRLRSTMHHPTSSRVADENNRTEGRQCSTRRFVESTARRECDTESARTPGMPMQSRHVA